MRRTIKDRLVSLLLILFFLAVIAGSGYLIVKMMIHWNVEGLG